MTINTIQIDKNTLDMQLLVTREQTAVKQVGGFRNAPVQVRLIRFQRAEDVVNNKTHCRN